MCDEKLNWIEAQNSCQALGTHLPHIQMYNVNKKIAALDRNAQMWMGVTDQYSDQGFPNP